MNTYIENIVIGIPIADVCDMFACSTDDWIYNESEKTYYTNERFLPRILMDAGIVPSISEVKRNKPELVKALNNPDFIEVKWGKRKLWILVGV